MISVSDFRNGVTFDMDGKVMQIIEFQHVKPGKGAAFVRVKMRNVITGGVTDMVHYINPIPAGLVLTGIVVSVSVSALMLSLTIRIYKKYHTLDIDTLYVMMSDRRKGGRV